MVIHPPIMFIGYASSAIPFSFAMAALWRKDDDGWARRAFPWALGGFMVLGIGDPDGRLLGLQDAGLGRLLGLGPGGERLVHPLAVRHRPDPRALHGAHQGALPARQLRARDPGLPVGPLRHLPDPLRRAGGLLGPQLRRPGDLRLADRPDGLLRPRLALPAGDPPAEGPDPEERGPAGLPRHRAGALDHRGPALGPGDHLRHLGAAPDRLPREPGAGGTGLLQPGQPADRDRWSPCCWRWCPT